MGISLPSMKPSPLKMLTRLEKQLKDSRHPPWKLVRLSTLSRMRRPALSLNSSRKSQPPRSKRVRRRKRKRKRRKSESLVLEAFFENYSFLSE
jgi:hypothetical protein